MRKAVFLDTAGLLALWDLSAQWHEVARKAYEQMLRLRRPLFTTSFVMLECGNSASRRPYRATVVRFCAELEAAGRLIIPTTDDWSEAWTAYSRGVAGDAGIVDHVSFVVMRRLGITDAFTNDKHFRAAGFKTLF